MPTKPGVARYGLTETPADAGLEIRRLIRTMSRANPLWGAPRIHGELLKLGIEISQASVSKYKVRGRKPPSQAWRTFLENHISELVSIDFLTVPTLSFRVLFVFVVLAHNRRRVVHFNVTDSPTSHWTSFQILQAFPWDTAPRYLLRDRDCTYGQEFRPASSFHGHRRSEDCSAFPMAESVCGAFRWHAATRLSRSCDRAGRESSAPDRSKLSRLLSRLPNAPVPGQGCTGTESH